MARIVQTRQTGARTESIRQKPATVYFDTASGLARLWAHALGNPLAGLSLTLELLALQNLSDEQKRLVDRAQKVAERLITFKENLCTLTATVEQNFGYQRIDTLQFCRELIDQQRLDNGYEVHLDIAPGAAHMDGNPGLLADLIGSLLRNATDASPYGSVLGIYAIPTDELPVAQRPNFSGVRVLVWDEGPGVPEAFVPHLFQSPVSSKPHGGGTGLMLAAMIVQRVHGGRILFQPGGRPYDQASQTAANAPDVKGSRFMVDLPWREKSR